MIEGKVFDLDVTLEEQEINELNKAFMEFMDPDTEKIDFYELCKTFEKKDIATTDPLMY